MYLIQCKQGTQVKIADFTLPEPPRDTVQPRKELPPLELMKLPSDHPQVVQAKMRWNTLLHPPKRKDRRG